MGVLKYIFGNVWLLKGVLKETFGKLFCLLVGVLRCKHGSNCSHILGALLKGAIMVNFELNFCVLWEYIRECLGVNFYIFRELFY